MVDFVLGIDIGTTGTKVVLLDRGGEIVSSYEERYPLHTPKPGWAEQDPQVWWQATAKCIQAIIRDSGQSARAIQTVGLSGQMSGVVLLDRHMDVLRPCITWADSRSGRQCEEMCTRVGAERLINITGKPAVPGYAAPKILWVREHEPEIYGRVSTSLAPKDFLRYRLTDTIATDPSDASNTLLFDIGTLAWSDEIIEGLQIPDSWLPDVCASTAFSGAISKTASGITGLVEGTPVVGGAGDSLAEAVANRLVLPGSALSVMGTAGNISVCLDRLRVDPLGRLHSGCHAVPDRWILTGVQKAAGLALRWVREKLKLYESEIECSSDKDPYEVLVDAAAEVPAGSEGLIFLPYLAGERAPHLDPKAKGVLFGLTMRHTCAHVVKAVMEGVAFAQRDALRILTELGIEVGWLIASGGGARSRHWRQILADVSRMRVLYSDTERGAAYGAGLLAAVGIGIFSSVEQASEATAKAMGALNPIDGNAERYEALYRIYASLYPLLKDSFAEIDRFS